MGMPHRIGTSEFSVHDPMPEAFRDLGDGKGRLQRVDVDTTVRHGDKGNKKGSGKTGSLYRADWIRTNDLLNPIQALYQTELQPATRASGSNLI